MGWLNIFLHTKLKAIEYGWITEQRISVKLIAFLAYHIDIQKENTTKDRIKQKIKNSQTCSLFPMAK